MKKMYVALMTTALLFVACAFAAAGQSGGISPSDVAGTPTAFCKVLKEPNPILLGGWRGVHNRWISRASRFELDPVEFWLKKYGDKYAIYFYRSKAAGGDKVLKGWRSWTINGDQIYSETGVKLFTQNGEVFFSWERATKEKPTKLTPIPGSAN